MPNAHGVRTKDIDDLWEDLVESKYFAKVGDKEYLPLICVSCEAATLWPFKDMDEEPLQTTFNESYDYLNSKRVFKPVSYTHLIAHETREDIVFGLVL